jgi:hypothetical protein
VIATDLKHEHVGSPIVWGAVVIDAHEIRLLPDEILIVERDEHDRERWTLHVPLDAEVYVIPPTELVPA